MRHVGVLVLVAVVQLLPVVCVMLAWLVVLLARRRASLFVVGSVVQ